MSDSIIDQYRYKGKHRVVPEQSSRLGTVSALAVAGGIATSVLAAPVANAAPTSPPGGWGDIIHCESGGRNIENQSDPNSSASGYFQFTNGTWRAFGGGEFAPRAIDATYEEQLTVANRAYARNGLRDWNASKRCWAGRSGPDPVIQGSAGSSPTARPQAASAPQADQEPSSSGRHRAAESESNGSYTVRRGDTLSIIAAKEGTTWRIIFDNNRDKIKNANLIYPGQKLAV